MRKFRLDICEDTGFVIEYETDDNNTSFVNFKVFEACRQSEAFKEEWKTVIEDREKDLVVSGYARRDGCINWDWVPAGHTCGSHGVVAMAKLVAAIFDGADHVLGLIDKDHELNEECLSIFTDPTNCKFEEIEA